jgi:hypothetical protein
VISEAEVKSFISIVVKGLKIDEFARFPVVEEFEVEVDVLDQEAVAVEEEFEYFAVVKGMELEVDVLDQEAVAVEEEFVVGFEEIGFEGVNVEFKWIEFDVKD